MIKFLVLFALNQGGKKLQKVSSKRVYLPESAIENILNGTLDYAQIINDRRIGPKVGPVKGTILLYDLRRGELIGEVDRNRELWGESDYNKTAKAKLQFLLETGLDSSWGRVCPAIWIEADCEWGGAVSDPDTELASVYSGDTENNDEVLAVLTLVQAKAYANDLRTRDVENKIRIGFRRPGYIGQPWKK